MNLRFDGQVIVITGAAGNLGRSYALEAARRGALVVANDLGTDFSGRGQSNGAIDKVVEEIRAAGGQAIASYASVADRAGGESIFSSAIEAFGKVDALINNAGNMRVWDFEDSDEGDIMSLLSIHLLGAFHVTRPIYQHMKERGSGRILFTGSGAMLGNATQTGYGASKGGIAGLMNALAVEGAPFGVLCNAILPAAETRMANAMKSDNYAEIGPALASFAAELQPQNCAAMALYLISRDCTSTHAMYSAVGNRFARVFMGVNEGWLADRGIVPTIEDIAAHFDDISAEKLHAIPSSMVDEYRIISDQLAATDALP